MKRTRSSEAPCVELKIPLKKFIELVQERFTAKIQKIELDSAKVNQIQDALKTVVNNILAEKFAVDGTVELTQIPLGALSASGKFKDKDAGPIVYVPGTGKHKPYIRKWVEPPNPDSVKQQAQQTLFGQVTQQWMKESDEIKSLWNQQPKKKESLTGQTLYISAWFKVGKETGIYPGLGFRPE